MSTKIYYGLKTTKSAPSLLEMGEALEPFVRPVFEKRLHLLVALEWAEVVGKATMDGETKDFKDISYYALIWDIEKKIDEASKSLQRDFIYGMDFSVTFLKGTSGRTLAWPCFQINEYYEALLKTGWFEEYGYWDNTDEPEGVSMRTWTARGKEWGKAMGSNYRAVDRGLTWEYKPMMLLDFTPGKIDWEAMKALSSQPENDFVKWCDIQKEKAKKDPWS